jgi:hypothetical protein
MVSKLSIFTILILAIVLITIANYPMLQLIAHKSKNNANKNQQKDMKACIDKSMQNLLNGDLNFSNPDPISHCFDQLLKGNANIGNGTQNNGGDNNNIMDNSTLSNV